MNLLEELSVYYQNGNLAHAYLITTNNIEKCMKTLLNVIKSIFCMQKYEENCNKCSLCHLIDLGNLPSLKIIEPDGSFIKKDQINSLISSFSKSSQFTKENIYIIKNCEKMNKESANTILKFLEEPNDDVIGFFITTDISNILPTIQSRCQHIDVNYTNSFCENLNISEERYQELYTIVKKYLEVIETNNKNLILNNKEYLNDLEKEDIINIFKVILDIYKNKLESTYGYDNNYHELNYLDRLSRNNIKSKINLVREILNELMYNVNIDLLLDRFIIEMDGINNEVI